MIPIDPDRSQLHSYRVPHKRPVFDMPAPAFRHELEAPEVSPVVLGTTPWEGHLVLAQMIPLM